MRLLVCGSRDWADRALLGRVLDGLRETFDDEPTIVQGEARGADRMAREWAEARGLTVEGWAADWSLGRGAGYARNAAMIASGVDGVVAFSTRWPCTRGTAHTCRLAYDRGLAVVFVTPDGRERHYQREAGS